MQVRKQQLELDMEQETSSKLGKEYIKAVYCNLYAEYIMRNVGLQEAQAGIKIAGRNFSNLRYADDTTLMAESEEVMIQQSHSWTYTLRKPEGKETRVPQCSS